MTDNWRDYQPIDVQDYSHKMVSERLQIGREEYGPRFVGDPLEHLKSEVADSMVYLFFVERQVDGIIQYHKEQNDELRKKLDMHGSHIEHQAREILELRGDNQNQALRIAAFERAADRREEVIHDLNVTIADLNDKLRTVERFPDSATQYSAVQDLKVDRDRWKQIAEDYREALNRQSELLQNIKDWVDEA